MPFRASAVSAPSVSSIIAWWGVRSDTLMKKLQIKAAGRNVEAGHLSGGNQQKVVLAKWLGTSCRVLLVDEPTRGIDINGRAEVYRILEELLTEGVSIVMFTSDYLEAMQMGNRVIVLHRGAIGREFVRGEATEEDILRVAIGEKGRDSRETRGDTLAAQTGERGGSGE